MTESFGATLERLGINPKDADGFYLVCAKHTDGRKHTLTFDVRDILGCGRTAITASLMAEALGFKLSDHWLSTIMIRHEICPRLSSLATLTKAS